MTIITLDDEFINNIIAVTNYKSPQEAIVKILADYLQQHNNKQTSITVLLAMPDTTDINFDPPRLTTPLFNPAD